MLHLVQAGLSPVIRDAIIADRDRGGHVHVMSAYERVGGNFPRAALGVLWHLDAARRVLTVQSHVPAESPGLLGEILSSTTIEAPEQGDSLTIRLLINCQKVPPANVAPEIRELIAQQKRDRRARLSADSTTPGASEQGIALKAAPGEGLSYRSRPVIVPEHERPAWAKRRFASIGLETEEEDISVGPLTTASLGKQGRGVPSVELHAQGTVADAEAFARAMRNGTGKAKSYGLALIRFTR